MKKVFILNQHQNLKLLHFTQTKIWFDANNQFCAWIDDIETIDSLAQLGSQPGVVIASGECVTTNFRQRSWDWSKQHNMIGDLDLIQFNHDYNYEIHVRPPFELGSKQLYVLENLYKTVLRSKKLIYLDNTEEYIPRSLQGSTLYGLASGWKTIRMFRDGRFDKVIVYDVCKRQLNFQQQLHSKPYIPKEIIKDKNTVGNNLVPNDIQDYWSVWHRTPVEFKLLDLFSIPTLNNNSVVWISNVFCYEPNIFQYGWEACKMARKSLQAANSSCIILEQ